MFEVVPVREHYEVYLDGRFFCSADTEAEAEREIESNEGGAKANES